jgi:hypothetical protein
VRDWRAWIIETARVFKHEQWALSADRGVHFGGYDNAVPWPEDQPKWMRFDYVHNGYVVVKLDGFESPEKCCYALGGGWLVPEGSLGPPIGYDGFAAIVRECERREQLERPQASCGRVTL